MTPEQKREYIYVGAAVLVILLLVCAGRQYRKCREQREQRERQERRRRHVTDSDWGFGFRRQRGSYHPDLPGDGGGHHHGGGDGYDGRDGYGGDGDGDGGGDGGGNGGGDGGGGD